MVQSRLVTGLLGIQKYIVSNPALFAHLTIGERKEETRLVSRHCPEQLPLGGPS